MNYIYFSLVEIANNTSPGSPKPSICLLKIVKKLLSLEIEVSTDEFDVNEIAGIDLLFLFKKYAINSDDK